MPWKIPHVPIKIILQRNQIPKLRQHLPNHSKNFRTQPQAAQSLQGNPPQDTTTK